VLYEDDHLIALNKQANLVVHPARSNLTGTLINGLAHYFRDTQANGLEALSSVGVDEFRPGVVHRLDKDTTGVIVVAKTDEAHWRLGRMFERREVDKYYLAITHGRMNPPGDVIDQPIGKHPAVAEACAVRNDGGGYARPAVTLYRVRELFDGFSLVELELKTGRTHQIRVHLTWLGFPIIGDIIYGGEPLGEPELADPPPAAGAQPMLSFARAKTEGVKIWNTLMAREDMLIKRPALHAAALRLTHPITGRTLKITAPLHADMRNLLARLRAARAGTGPLPPAGARVNLADL
jgi:23S rRNA pseudouridine1911/1915/1917 synthase